MTRKTIEQNLIKLPKYTVRKPRAIVCDDDPHLLSIFKRILGKRGYEVLTVETPMTCAFYRNHVDTCPQHNRCTDVLITDYQMPNMTGMELLVMRHRGGCKLTSRNKLLITASEDSDVRKRAEALGCQFFPKPLRLSSFISWIKDCEAHIDLSEPLADELYQPAMNKSLNVTPPL